MQINPREYVTLVRGLEDHADATTYYVQAVIRNGKTDALIDTVNLTDNGNRRFTAQWQAPADVSGDGLYIVVTYTVYTDSGYSTKAENYGEKFDEHLIQIRPVPSMMGGGGDGVDVDYKKIRKIVQEVMAELKIPAPVVKLEKLEKLQSDMLSELRQIDIPEMPETDLKPLESSLISLKKDLLAVILERPKFEKTDLQPILSQIPTIQAKLDEISSPALKSELEGILNEVRDFFGRDIEQIRNSVKTIMEFLNKINYVVVPEKPKITAQPDVIDQANQLANEKTKK